ncbi:hypothetical protein Lal_00043279 [Lupinus albus]|uniref:Putative transcription factor C2H2 family n=1 Tax=Lupinus albus TaxID=3870 RepID=A0A6A4QW33_LUPAL|nr:putative transcription factor C2H2 family [Lupinus albus]KAF1896329.1 hypothetical protein Lal_00043279 [Lupinus albus]
MSNNFSNLRRDVLNYAQHPINTDQIACRLCKQVFRNTQALVAHIDSHMEHEEVAIRRLYSPNYINSQRQISSSLFPPNFPLSMQQPETQNFTHNNRIFQQPRQQHMDMPQPRMNSFFNGNQVGSSSRQTQLSPMFFASAGNNNVTERVPLRFPQFHQRSLTEVSPIDGTRPFILQLEKPIKTSFNDFMKMHDAKSDVQSLNLTLKL